MRIWKACSVVYCKKGDSSGHYGISQDSRATKCRKSLIPFKMTKLFTEKRKFLQNKNLVGQEQIFKQICFAVVNPNVCNKWRRLSAPITRHEDFGVLFFKICWGQQCSHLRRKKACQLSNGAQPFLWNTGRQDPLAKSYSIPLSIHHSIAPYEITSIPHKIKHQETVVSPNFLSKAQHLTERFKDHHYDYTLLLPPPPPSATDGIEQMSHRHCIAYV
jgi:hypothetical protein